MSDISAQTEPLDFSLHLGEGVNPSLAISALSVILDTNDPLSESVVYQADEGGVEITRIGKDIYIDPVFI